MRVGYLDQYSVNGSEKSIWEETLTVFADVIEMENQLDEIRFDIENNNGNIDELVKRQTSLQEAFAERDGFYYKSKVKSTLTGLGFSEDEFDLCVDKLSGGQKRVSHSVKFFCPMQICCFWTSRQTILI